MLEAIIAKSNFSRAVRKVMDNDGAAGIDGMEAKHLLQYLNKNRGKIKNALRNGTYRPSPVRRVEIPKPDGKKRQLGIPTIVDRVVQQAILQVLTPIYEPRFSDASYGYRPGRNAQGAVLKCRSYLNDGYAWAVDLDIEKFFDTVNQHKVMQLLSKKIKDGRVLSLVWKFVRAGALRRGKFEPTKRGVPQGGPLSPLLANILLDRLDKELERLGQKFVRYADDMVILCKDKRNAKQILRHVAGFLENKLRLNVNRDKTAVVYANKIQFLGFGFYKSGAAFQLRVHPKALRRMTARIDTLLAGNDGENRAAWKERLRRYIGGWVNFYRLADMGNTLKTADETLRKKIRLRIQALWEQALAELGDKSGTETGSAACTQKMAALRPEVSPAIRPLLSKRRLENDGFPNFSSYYSAHFAAIAC